MRLRMLNERTKIMKIEKKNEEKFRRKNVEKILNQLEYLFYIHIFMHRKYIGEILIIQ